MLCNEKELRAQGLQGMTEIKFENSIDRITAVAKPRQIERVVRGTQFGLNLIYEAEKEEEIAEDFEVLARGFALLQYDYLGGNGSRGYGKVKFHDLAAETVIGEVSEEILEACNQKLKDV